MDVDFLLVGLGNPGGEYVRSPHNAGFEVADKVRAACRGPRFCVKGDSLLSPCRWRGKSLLLLKPQTYMNLSGVEVEKWVARTRVELDRLVVCYDDLDLPLGQLRMRPSGGAGGHHGMESILARLGSGEFPRIRLGIQDPEIAKHEHVDYLLSPLSEERRARLDEAVEAAARAFLDAVHFGWNKAMSLHNRRSVNEEDGLKAKG